MKTKKPLIGLLCILALLLTALLGAKPLYNLYRDLSFSWEERSEQAWEIKAFAESRNISIGEYPWEIIALYENNPETRDFVLNYPFREDVKQDLSAYEGSTTVPLFLQWDSMWGYSDYGSSCIAVTGCGPTCLAMVGYYLTGDDNMNPREIAKFAQREGYYESGYGSSWTLISEGAGKLGLTAKELPLVKKKITDALANGSPVILALGKGDFTSSGHYIVLTGYEDGAFTVNDPNSRIRSEKQWTYEQLESQIRNIWAISK
ncbi:MAG: C39 family peptidase [Oscillospiraceae bacterium]|nr:C39 family peptidase [Oscillospiraceae bacterium]MBQ7130236.1 C39 family peptidase [Oscillospiraceae bacterium]